MNRGTGRCCLGPLSGITLWLVLSVCLQAATVATPTFTKTRGFYTATFSVSLSCATSGATIRFTTDGSKPTPSHGTVYSGAFSISDTTCLRAVGCKSGYTTSTTMTHTYVFPDKVKNQPNYMSGENWSDAAARMNTQMDPSIVGSSTYSSRVVPALKAIPSMSIAMSYADLFGDANGICHYPNSETRGLGGERECSVEMIGKDGSSKFQLNCGIRIFGNSSHVDRILAKKSFRLLFKGAYGPKKLNYALFADAPNEAGSAVSVLDSVVLRGGHNNMWGGWEAFNPSTQRITYTRDQWVRDSQIAMSGYGYHGTFVHLYLNGVYWGLYNPCEGTEPCFMRDYFGGNKEDWFTTTHDTRSQDSHHGSYTQWAYLHSTLRKKDLSVAANYTAVTQYLDVENYVDYLILNWYAGVGDWPHKNYGASNRNSPAGPVRYFVWDAESCFIDVAGRSSDGAWIHYDYLRATPSSLSGLLWQKLLANRDFKTTFADRLYKHCHHDGALTDAKAKARFDVLNSRVDKAVIAESARWGDCIEDRISLTYNRDTHWVNAKNAIRNSMTGNAADFESICVSKGFYPGIKPPEFVQRGGTVAAGYKVTLSNPNGSTGQIYYTTDGSDPRKSGGALGASAALYGAPLTLTATATVRARVYKTAATWSALNLATFTVTGSVVTVPTAPSGLAAAAQSTTSIRLTWTDNSGNETVFKVDRSPDGSSWTRVAEPAANTTAWTDSGLAAGTKYYYRVKASNSAGDSGYSNVATATTDESLPAQPSNLAAASLSSTSIKVTWTDTSDNETQFKIRRSLDGADWDTLAPVFPAANATSYTDSGLSGGTTYYYKIRSENAAGVSAYTAPVAATTGVATPAAPSGLTATAVSSTSVALSWTDNASNETQYKIDRRRSGTDTWVRVAEPGANTTAYTDSGLSPNTDYYYMVKASNAAGNSPYSNVAPVTTDETVPAQPANLAALSLSATSIQVTWTDTSDNETQFKIRRSLDGADWDTLAPVFPAANATSYTDSGLSGGTTYYYKIRSENAAGVSAYTAPVTATTGVATPAAPSGLTATAVSSTSVALSWTDNASNETRYKIDRRRSGTDTWVRVAEPGANTTRHTDSGLSPNTHYYYMVKASNAAGDSAYSGAAAATTPAALDEFAAYNDLAWASGQLAQNITTYTRGESGLLVDHATGQALGVQISLNSGGYGPVLTQGADPEAGTDAARVFGGIVDCVGVISHSADDLTLTLSGLDPAKRYELVLFGNRHNPAYTARLTTFTLSDVAGFSNRSSDGADYQGASDASVVTCNGYNTANGYAARYVNIDPGRDGDLLVTVADGVSGCYVNALMLRCGGGSQQREVDKIGEGGTWKYRKGTAEASDAPAAWREAGFDDGGWASGATPMGYSGSGSVATELADMRGIYSCVFLRKSFTAANPWLVSALNLSVSYDDGFVMWINGREVARVNVAGAAGSALSHDGFAAGTVEPTAWTATLAGSALPALQYTNVVAVQVFNSTLSSSDLVIDVGLSAVEGSPLDTGRDSDGDGMDDAWEQATLGGAAATGEADADGDGISNLEEYIAGTDPRQQGSCFAVEVGLVGGQVEVSFETVPASGPGYTDLARHYALEACPEADEGNWLIVPGYEDILGAGQTVTYEPSGDAGASMYQGRVWLE